MKCPLLSIVKVQAIGPRNEILEDCIEEQCAWWNEPEQCCHISMIEFDLVSIAGLIAKIKDKMPE